MAVRLPNGTLSWKGQQRLISFPDSLSNVRVIIADDNPEVRRALQLLLTQEAAFGDIAEALTLADTLELVPDFDLVLLDLELPGLDASGLESLRRTGPGVRILGMTSRVDVPSGLLSRVDGVVNQLDGPSALLQALRGLFEGPEV